MNEETQGQGQTQQQEPVQISLQDLATVVQLIDIVSRRGGIEGQEMAGVGMLRNKLELFLRQQQPQGEDGAEGPGPEVPANVPMADKIMS